MHYIYFPLICQWTAMLSMSWPLWTALQWTWVNVSSWVMVFSGYMPGSGMAGSFGSSSFNFFFSFFLHKLDYFNLFFNWRKITLHCHVGFCCVCVCVCVLSHFSRVWLLAAPCSLPSSSVYGVLQARILKWVAMAFSKGSSPARDQTHVS